MNQLKDQEFDSSLKKEGHFFDVCVTPYRRMSFTSSNLREEIKSALLSPGVDFKLISKDRK